MSGRSGAENSEAGSSTVGDADDGEMEMDELSGEGTNVCNGTVSDTAEAVIVLVLSSDASMRLACRSSRRLGGREGVGESLAGASVVNGRDRHARWGTVAQRDTIRRKRGSARRSATAMVGNPSSA